ncbi:glycosyltransferase family 87 protein [Novosphingobium soli]|uniref:Glycosyltransferase family 87 protein n=1 Tax=Novosphingobium soli TaxID=574956 RepID=A0ABV6CTC6_9SPHN
MRGDLLRRMDWLGPARARGYLRLLAVLNLAALVALVATARGGVDRNGFLLGSDFLSFWTVGRMLHAGAEVYDTAAHIAAQRTHFAAETGYTAFFYPPSFLPFCWPLGLAHYIPALAGWLVATAAVYIVAARAWRANAGVGAPLWLLFVAFPAVPIVVTHGQTSFLVAGLLGLGAWLVPSRRWIAGVLLGLATIKPQFGVLVPLVLLLTREWRTAAAAFATAVALASFAALAFGAHVWTDWLATSGQAEAAMAAGAMGFGKMISPFAALKLMGAPTGVAYAGQGVVSAVVAGTLAGAAWGRRWSPALAAPMLCGALLATPFALDYDAVLLGMPMLWLAGRGLETGFRDWEKLALLLAFAAPAFARPLALHAGLPVMPLIVGLLFAVLWRRARSEPMSAADQDPAVGGSPLSSRLRHVRRSAQTAARSAVRPVTTAVSALSSVGVPATASPIRWRRVSRTSTGSLWTVGSSS